LAVNKMKLVLITSLLAFAIAAPQSRPESRIVGGTATRPGEIPFQVVIEDCETDESCTLWGSGTILNANTILSAASVFRRANVTNLRVTAGEYSLSQVSPTNPTEQHRKIVSFIQHPKYRPTVLYSDIALVYLDKPLELNSFVVPVNLPPGGLTLPAGYVMTTSGWGTTSFDGPQSDVLLKVDVPIIPDETCVGVYGNIRVDPATMICAGRLEGGVDACLGDSGGPLFTNFPANGTQYGIVTWGQGCAEPGTPGVYTEVSSFIEWINENIV